MKNFLCDLLWLIILAIGSGMIYMGLMLLFGLMPSWPHWLVVIFFIFVCGSLIQVWGLANFTAAIPFKTPVGVALACIDMLSQLFFSIKAVWTSLPSRDGWGITINVLATIVFLTLFIGIVYALIVSYIARKNEDESN